MHGVFKRPIRGETKLLRPDQFPLVGGDVQDKQLVSILGSHVDAKVNGLKGAVISLANEVIEMTSD